MKKLLSVLLAATMVIGLASTAFADSGSKTFDSTNTGEETPPYTQTISVKAKVKDGSIKTRYNVKVEWADLTFTFDRSAQTWNPETHLYEGDGEWVDDGTIEGAIKVTNHSNAEVEVTATAPSVTSGVTTALSVTAATTLANASVGDIYGAPDKAGAVSYDVTVSGTPTTDAEFTVGDITVTIAAV